MKRVFSLALTALLLAGCTAAPADGNQSSAAVTAETAAAQASTGNGEPLRLLQHGDEKQYYFRESVDNTETLLRYRIADLTQYNDYIPAMWKVAPTTVKVARQSPPMPLVTSRGFWMKTLCWPWSILSTKNGLPCS